LGRIVEMNIWDNDFLDLVDEAHLTFGGKSDSEIVLAALKGFLDMSYGTATGRGVLLGRALRFDPSSSAPRVSGQFHIHNGDDSGFVCQRA
jgi:hypothetical protein